MKIGKINSYKSLKSININGINYKYFDLETLSDFFDFDLSKIPNTKIGLAINDRLKKASNK